MILEMTPKNINKCIIKKPPNVSAFSIYNAGGAFNVILVCYRCFGEMYYLFWTFTIIYSSSLMSKPMISTKQLMGMQIALCPQGNWDDCSQLCLISMELSFKDSSFVLKVLFLYLLSYACDANAQASNEEKKQWKLTRLYEI